MATRMGVRSDAAPGSLLLVVHDFVARSADELSLAKGDRIELIERDDDFGDGWFLGRHMINGHTGLFPEVYTTPAPKGTLASAGTHRRASEGPLKPSPSIASIVSPTGDTAATQARHISAPMTTSSPTSSLITAPPVMPTSPPLAPSAIKSASFNANSPVMNETLSVIDEHITDMNTPRSSYTNKRDTISSVYSAQPLNRFSYIPGHETDEDEHQLHTEEEVMAWLPARVAEYLEDQGVERLHCDVFKDQEISGEVLLAMDQSSIFIKEFELGPVGRRLKTWHKIKSLQDEVRQTSGGAPKPPSELSAGDATDDAQSEVGRNRSSTMGTPVPRALSTRQSSDSPARSNTLQPRSSSMSSTAPQSDVLSPLAGITAASQTPENAYRPSAQSIRNMNHSRRHSSLDSTNEAGERLSHRKQPSLDKSWQLGQATMLVNGRSSHVPTKSTDSTSNFPHRESSLITPASPSDLDRGYFSSNEAEKVARAPKGNRLSKRISTSASATSIVSPLEPRTHSFTSGSTRTGLAFAHASSTDNLQDTPVSPLVASAPPQYMYSAFNAIQHKFGSSRSATLPQFQSKPMVPAEDSTTPVVTKLQPQGLSSSKSSTALHNTSAGSEPSSIVPTPSPSTTSLALAGSEKNPKTTGLRAISDAITRSERKKTETLGAAAVSKDEVSSPTPTGSTTPSTDTRSFDLQKSEAQVRSSTGSAGKLAPPPTPASTRRARPKTKKATSAYTRGLEKKPPQEQLAGCDYSGWMKKKSGSLMTTWKARLFILRGRRLSYYYSDTDTEEKGLIDISFHRVLPATNETLTGLHAAMTGAAASPTSPINTSTPTAAQQDLKLNPPAPGEKGDDSGLFIFKLVPPKTGLSKAVNFTKPTVHYFAVNSRREGRLWMAALMKATIDRDETGVVTTTYNQKTISLAKARERMERPPALKEEAPVVVGPAELEGHSVRGLGIDNAAAGRASGGVGNGTGAGAGAGVEGEEKNDSAVGGAERELEHEQEAEQEKTGLRPVPAVADGKMDSSPPAITTADERPLTASRAQKEAVPPAALT